MDKKKGRFNDKKKEINLKKKTAKKPLLKIPKNKFISKGNAKEEEKELQGPANPKSRSTEESEGIPIPESQNIEIFYKT